MRIATWNINSVRLRLDLVLRFLAEHQPDILALQETKATNVQFPAEALARAGWPHQHVDGMPGYNGVALVSRLPLTEVGIDHWCARHDCRHVYATVGGVELHNLYVPAGGDVPDPEANVKFAHKLQFLDDLALWWRQRRDPARPIVLVGDLNVAPLEQDVWSHRQMLDVVSHTPAETERFRAAQAAFGWVDAMRRFVPPEEKLYTWWSYRARDWRLSDRGRRLDHVWVSTPLAPALDGLLVLKDARDWPRPSDHVPVAVDLAL